MRIAHVVTRLLRAGSEENTLLTCRAQAAAGHDVFLIHGRAFDPGTYAAETDRLRFVEVESLVHAVSPFHDCRALIDLRNIFRRLKPQIVHTHQSKAGVIGRFAARLAGVPCVVHGI
ncbi:MAG: glycosyltransferase [Alphaproteobacteria bacterium]